MDTKLKFIVKLKSFLRHPSFFNSGKNSALFLLTAFSLIMTAGILFTYASPWTGPAQTPAGGNVDVPINVGSVDQYKLGGLGIGGAVGQSLQWLKNIGGTLQILNASNNPNLTIGQDGNVGIGTTNPEQRLHVISSSDQGAIFETFRSEGDGCWGASGNGAGCDTEMHFRSARGTPASPAALQEGDEITEWYADGYDGSDWSSSMHIAWEVDGPVSPGNMPTKFELREPDDNVFFSVRSSGNVGIGTTNPSAKLEVASPGNYTSIRIKNLESTPGVWELRSMQIPTNNNGLTIWGGSQGSEADRLVITKNGNVGIGYGDPWEKLVVDGNVWAWDFQYASDVSLKKDIVSIPDALQKILSLQGVSFKWKDSGKLSVGLIAQDVEKIFPELVSTNPKTGLKSVEYGNLVAPLIEAIKEQQKEINQLRAEMEELKKMINK